MALPSDAPSTDELASAETLPAEMRIESPFLFAAGLASLALLALACASSGPGVPLERVYRTGAPKDTALIRAENQENMWAYARPLTGDAGRDLLPAGAAEALGPEKLARATGYDAYDARLRHVSGYTVSWERFCDVIFHDVEDRIVGFVRRPGRCLQLPR